MNTSTIIEMITEDPTILNDTKGFLNQVNKQNRPIQTVTRDIILVSQKMTSYAELNGGIATQENIDMAIKIMSQKPLEDKAKEILDDTYRKINDGTITDPSSLAQEITASATDIIGK